jgi:hypothetical protein
MDAYLIVGGIVLGLALLARSIMRWRRNKPKMPATW